MRAGQIDRGVNKDVTQEQAADIGWAAKWAANLMGSNSTQLAAAYSNFDAAQLLQATAASYNFGTGNISGNADTIDVGTTRGNYGSNVLDLMDCFD